MGPIWRKSGGGASFSECAPGGPWRKRYASGNTKDVHLSTVTDGGDDFIGEGEGEDEDEDEDEGRCIGVAQALTGALAQAFKRYPLDPRFRCRKGHQFHRRYHFRRHHLSAI